jgi:FMN phosphatase YigB (HAD superfamily)
MSRSARALARPVRAVFLDDGGVLNDNERRAPEWRRLLGEFFAPLLGGTPEAWGEANRVVFDGIWRDWQSLLNSGAEAGPDWWPAQDPRWLAGMCEGVGVPVPADVDGTVKACRRHVMARIDCAYPDAAAAMQAMRDRGITLHLASGGRTDELEPYMRRMGVWELIGKPYGVDLLGVSKTGPRYYERIAEDSGVDRREAIVVDDSATVLEWADATGFRAVHMDRAERGSRFERITSLDGLLPLLT